MCLTALFCNSVLSGIHTINEKSCFNVSVNRYKFLDSKFVGKSLSVVLPKLAADALLVTPVNLTLFYVGK